MSIINIEGMIFDRLTVIKYIGLDKNRKALWLCKCNCKSKKEIIVRGSDLRRCHTKSCGCLQIEAITNTGKYSDKNRYNTYDLTGEYGIGQDSNNKYFYFDLEDYDKIKNICWIENEDGYFKSTINNKHIFLHRIILNIVDDLVDGDHIYHRKYDNRKKYLRIATRSQNSMNRILPSNNTSGCKGVHFDKNANKWCSRISINKKRVVLGYYNNLEEAIKIRKNAEEIYYGEYRYKEESRGC